MIYRCAFGKYSLASCGLFCGLALLLVLLHAACAPLPSRAEDAKPTDWGAIKGGVVKIDVTMDDLRDARLSTSRVRKAAANLYDEVTRREMTMIMNPNTVGSTVIMTPIPVSTGQLLPARKQWVDASMSEIGPIIKLLKEDVDRAVEDDRRTSVSESGRKALESVRDDIFALVRAAFDRYTSLVQLTVGPSYDNAAIAAGAKDLDDDMKKLDSLLKKGISILQKEAKRSKTFSRNVQLKAII